MDLFVTNMHADMWHDWPSGPSEKQKAPVDAVPPERYLKSRAPGMTIFGNAFYENEGKGWGLGEQHECSRHRSA